MTKEEKQQKRKEWNTRYNRTLKGVFTRIYGGQKYRSLQRGWKIGYTKEELINKYSNDNQFISLYNGWVASGYKHTDYPTLDRIDNHKAYTFDNIQPMRQSDNSRKATREDKLVRRRSLISVDRANGVATYYPSLRFAATITKSNEEQILTAIRNGHKHRNLEWILGEKILVPRFEKMEVTILPLSKIERMLK